MSRNRIIVGAVLVILLSVLGYRGYVNSLAPKPDTPTPGAQDTDSGPETVSAKGEVLPGKRANLSFSLAGRLVRWDVGEGDRVRAGQLLGRISSPEVEQAVPQAQAALAVAQAQLARAQAGARPEELAQADQAVAAARAGLSGAQRQISAARSRLDAARAALAELRRGARAEDVAIAQANRDKAREAVKQAQAAYDPVAARPDVASLPQSLALQQATLDLQIAQAQYDRLVNGATAEELDAAEAQVHEAEAGVATAQAQVESARAQLGQAQAKRDLVAAGSSKEEMAILVAQVDQAEAALARAQAVYSETRLIAPFDGTVAHRLVQAGEIVAPGIPVLSLGDLSQLVVETNDLSEVSIANVRAGQQVSVEVDALPGKKFAGQVLQVRPQAEIKRGDTTYTVIIALNAGPADGLRWGMTAFVDIDVGR
ncbi:MAG: HlyD family efflux transporter periplasmic adaptor subunit [Chloroflexi bacterium]|nr:HlyD family efflux transporter periplasmic adaptor subunit [Chloroflexota bacterium]